MLFRIIKNMIAKGMTDGLREKIGILLLSNSITTDEHATLIEMLGE